MNEVEKTVKQSIFVRLMDVLTHRIKTKVIFFEIFIILFVALTLGLATTFYMQYVLTQKAHQFSERIMKDLAKSIEYNYISLPATDEAVKSYSETPGILYLGYQGFIMTGGKPTRTHLYIGNPIDVNYYHQIETMLKELQGFKFNPSTVLFSINNEDIPTIEYYMPVFVGAGTVNKRLGNIVLRYSKQIIINEINNVRILIAIITLIIIVLGIYISIRGSNSIVRPIVQLTDTVRRFGKGDMSIRINMPVKDEIGMLAKTFDEMIVSIREKLEMQKFVSGSTIKMIQSSVADNPGAQQKEKHTEACDQDTPLWLAQADQPASSQPRLRVARTALRSLSEGEPCHQDHSCSRSERYTLHYPWPMKYRLQALDAHQRKCAHALLSTQRHLNPYAATIIRRLNPASAPLPLLEKMFRRLFYTR